MWVIAHIGGNSMDVYTARDLGAAARQKRETLGMTQQALADAAGVTRDWLLDFEAGNPSSSLGRVFTVLNTLHLHVDLTDTPEDESDSALDDVFRDLDR